METGGGKSRRWIYGTIWTEATDIREYGYSGRGDVRKNSDAVDMDPHNHVKVSRGKSGQGWDRGLVSVAEVLEVGIRGGCDDRLKEVVAVSQLRRWDATHLGNVNGNREKLAAAASFENKSLASSFTSSDRDDSD